MKDWKAVISHGRLQPSTGELSQARKIGDGVVARQYETLSRETGESERDKVVKKASKQKLEFYICWRMWFDLSY